MATGVIANKRSNSMVNFKWKKLICIKSNEQKPEEKYANYRGLRMVTLNKVLYLPYSFPKM